MAVDELDTRRRQEGEFLVSSLRASGIDVLAAFWTYRSAIGDWRLVIVTSQVETQGPKNILRRAFQALQKIEGGASFTFFDLQIESPRSSAIMEFISHPMDFHDYSSYREVRYNETIIESIFTYNIDRAKILEANRPVHYLAAE